MWQKSKFQNMRKVWPQNVTKLKNLGCDKTQKLKMWQNSTTQNVTKIKKSKCDTLNNSKF